VSEKVNEENNLIQQNLLEEALSLHCIQASCDMGWQVCSPGGKYASPTGHGLLIGVLTNEVLDNIAYKKKIGICRKQFSCTGTYQNVKKRKCMINYQGTSKAMGAQALLALDVTKSTRKRLCLLLYHCLVLQFKG
jgi:hypothetical protein